MRVLGGAVNKMHAQRVRSGAVMPRSQITRDTIVSRPALRCTISPVALRFLITAPAAGHRRSWRSRRFRPRRAITPPASPVRLGGRDREALHEFSTLKEREFLVRDAHDDLVQRRSETFVASRRAKKRQRDAGRMISAKITSPLLLVRHEHCRSSINESILRRSLRRPFSGFSFRFGLDHQVAQLIRRSRDNSSGA